jgi:hypothetical protein
MELGNYIHGHLERAAADPKDNLLGALATACSAGEFDQLTAQLMMVILFSAGGESTGSLLGNSMGILTTRPELQQRVQEDPDLVERFIEEVLRYEPPFRGHYRHVVADTTLGGTDLPAGSRLLLLWGRRTGIRPNSIHPASSGSTDQVARGTSPSVKGTLLRRRRARATRGSDRSTRGARPHLPNRRGRCWTVAAEHSRPPPRTSGTRGEVTGYGWVWGANRLLKPDFRSAI